MDKYTTTYKTDVRPFDVWLGEILSYLGWSQTELLSRSQDYIKSRGAISTWLSEENSRTPGARGCVGIYVALRSSGLISISLQEVLYRAGHAPPISESVAQEEKLVDIFRGLDEEKRVIYLSMGESLLTTMRAVNGNSYRMG